MTRAKECLKLSIEVTLLQWKVCDVPQLQSNEIFCYKLAYLMPRAQRKRSQLHNLQECDPPPRAPVIPRTLFIVVLY